MNTNRLAGWLLMMGPIGMFSIWFILDPILIGEVADGLSPSEEAIAGLQLNLDKEIPSNILNLVGGFAFLGLFAGYTLLSRSLQGAGATYGTLCSLIFPVMIAIATVGFGLSVEAQMHLSEGYPEHAANLEIASNGMFGAFPMIVGLGLLLLGIGITREKAPLPAGMGWVLALFGVLMSSGMFVTFGPSGIGPFIFMGWMLVTLATGILLLRKAKAA